VHQHPRASCRWREPGELVLPHGLETRVRESNGVQHSARELGDARPGVPAARLRRDCFGDDSAQGFEVDHTGHLVPETGGAGSEEDGVLEGDAEQRDRGEGHRPLAGGATARLRSRSSKYATMPSAIALAILCWPRLEARNAPSVRFVANPVSTRMAGRRAVVSTVKPA